ncbi:hypothetical protein GUITHDRAFT_113951 [Guillardia theta CCMP2712]|uniref:Uncharacterized protein n=1 Tax=Guillardia theta (strain CCMP2712) TaxID=905079 RepID=L1IVN7_GUITC|nr:hypothetical protein GUITHDRAFT_113951 [Guillardia theta CCMP2712]EKX39959.1 hypothetical protein GUITHDRAFT_113951 [Guillardia theta CCMP2712]|eukprot:XP_005826939.1 hypothetical protein GUITHDRAFT_113951 [Guillardia theta CCMP2712]
MSVVASETTINQSITFERTIYVLSAIPIAFIFVVLLFGLTGSRAGRRRKEIQDVKQRFSNGQSIIFALSASVTETKLPHIPKSHRTLLNKNLYRSCDISSRFQPDDKHINLPGWGRLNSNGELKNYRSLIATSYRDIVLKCCKKDLNAAFSENVETFNPREAMLLIMKRYPDVDSKTALRYLRLYESARFSKSVVREVQILYARCIGLILLRQGNIFQVSEGTHELDGAKHIIAMADYDAFVTGEYNEMSEQDPGEEGSSSTSFAFVVMDSEERLPSYRNAKS